MAISNGVGAGVILSVMGGGVFTNVLAAPNAWPTEVLAIGYEATSCAMLAILEHLQSLLV